MVQVNVGKVERTASLVLGGLALAQAFQNSKGLVTRAASGSAGLALLWRGLSGNCPVYSGLNLSSEQVQPNKPQTWIERSALVNRSLTEVQAGLEGPLNPYGTFTSTGENIYELSMDGRLWMLNLSEHADGKRTLIRMSWDDQSAKPSLGERLKNVREPAPRILELRMLKALLETGEVPTVEGQSHGERSRFGDLVEKVGHLVIEKIQSQTALPEEPHINEDFPARRTYLKELKA